MPNKSQGIFKSSLGFINPEWSSSFLFFRINGSSITAENDAPLAKHGGEVFKIFMKAIKNNHNLFQVKFNVTE